MQVLVTRAAHGSSELADHLRALGAEPILVPAIEFTPPTSFAVLDAALAQLNTFDWLVFTSATAVDALRRRQGGRETTHMPTIAAIGPATARALPPFGLTASLVPPLAVAESLTQTLLPHARRPDGSPARFLLIRAEEAREHLPDTLRSAGAEVTVAPAYRTAVPAGSVGLLREVLGGKKPRVAAVTFTSASTARNLVALCDAACVSLPSSALRISIGPITSQTLRELGIPAHAESPEATVASLASTVMAALRRA